MLRTHRPIAAAVSLALAALLILPAPALAQSRANTSAPQGSSAAKRTAWILVGAGLGFGAGLLFGLDRFDDAVYSERKVWTSALAGAAIGGVAAGALSWDAQPAFIPKTQPTAAPRFAVPRFGQKPGETSVRDRVSAANHREFSVGTLAPAGAAPGALIDTLR